MRPFDVHVPNLEGDGIAETVRIEVPVQIDLSSGEEILTPEAHELIEKTKLRLMGLMSPEEIEALRERLGLTQDEMSQLLQIGAKTYTRWESGRARPSRSMNVLLCALRDGQLDVNYLLALNDPETTAVWVTRNRARALFVSYKGAVKLTKMPSFVSELAESSKHWSYCASLAGFISSIVIHSTDAPEQTAWLFNEMKTDEKRELKASMPRTLAARLPENVTILQSGRRCQIDVGHQEVEEPMAS